MTTPLDDIEENFDRRIALIEQAIDRFGDYLLRYVHSLCKGSSIDADVLYDDLWIYVLNRFPEERMTHVGFLRFKLYQIFIDAWRKMKRSPISSADFLPDTATREVPEEITSKEDEDALKRQFFLDHPVDLASEQKEALFLWARYGHTYAEISAILNKPRSTVADWVKLGREAIIKYIESRGRKVQS